MTAPLAEFLKIAASEADFVEQFVRLLEQEKTLLTEGRTEALAAVVEKKEQLAAKLNALTQQRGRHLAEHGFTPDRNGMTSWSDRHPEQKEAIAAWNRTLSLAARAQELNRLNGQLIQLHMQHTGQALEILLRKDNGLDLYGPDGRSTALGNQQINDTI
ncbi:MAG: flagellar protein FlgN [Candidatus Accumulibacter sp.]|nr:flagellar protein FlgN [Accumulibacter sp.]